MPVFAPQVNPLFLQVNAAPNVAQAASFFLNASQQDTYLETARLFVGALREADVSDLDSFEQAVGEADLKKSSVALAALVANLPKEIYSKTKKTSSWMEQRTIFAERVAEAVKLNREAERLDLGGRIKARTEILREFGIPNAFDVAETEARMGFELDLDPAAIQAKADELAKEFYDVTVPLPETFRDLPDRQQKTLKQIGKALLLLNDAHRFQVSPFGDVFETLVMETKAYQPLRKFYQRFAGVYDPLNPDKKDLKTVYGFLPGMEKTPRYKGGGYYPFGMTLEEFRLFVPEGSSLDEEMRVIFKFNEEGKFVAEPFSKVLAKWLDPAARLIEGAALLFEEDKPEVAGYLREVAKAYRDNDFPSVDRRWVHLQDEALDMDLSPVEQYWDEIRGFLAEVNGDIQVRDPKMEATLTELKAAFPEYEEALPVPDAYKRPDSLRKPPPVFVVNNIFATKNNNAKAGTTAAYNRPNDEKVRSDPKFGNRIVILNNVVETLREQSPVGRRLKSLALYKDQRELVTSEGSSLFVFMHEEAHGNGLEHVVGEPGRDATKALGETGRSFEELRADIVGLHNSHVAYGKGLISLSLLHQAYISAVYRAVGSLRAGISGAHQQGELVTLNRLQEAGAVTIHPKTGRTRIHLEKMPEAIRDFAREIQIIKGDGNAAKAKTLYDKYGREKPSGLDVIYTALEDLPKAAIVKYAFEDLLKSR